MISRRSVVLAGSIGLLIAHRLSRGQPAATIRRVGWLSIGSESQLRQSARGVKAGNA